MLWGEKETRKQKTQQADYRENPRKTAATRWVKPAFGKKRREKKAMEH